MGGTGQVGYGPLTRIDGPPPIAPEYGLLQAAAAPLAAGVRIVPDLDENGRERWMNGVQVYPYPPDMGDVYDPCASGSNFNPMGYGLALDAPAFGAMTVWLAETCTSSRVWDQDQFKARAVATLSAVEGATIAKEFLHGTRLPLNPHLSDGNGVFPDGNTAVAVYFGLALLEDVIALSGRLGLIHCSPGVATIMRERFTIDNRTGVLRTINGNVVIPDSGYVGGATPAGHPAAGANQEWMYASGPVDLRRTEIFVMPETLPEALDRGAGATRGLPNAITYYAERYYLVDWDQEVQAAVLVDRTL